LAIYGTLRRVAAMRAVLFDLDDTLTSRRESVEAFAGVFAADWAGRLETVNVAAVRDVLLAVDRGGYNPRRAEDLRERLAWRRAPAAAALEAHWQERLPATSVMREGVASLLAELRRAGVKLGCVTNGGALGQRAKLAHLGLAEAFDTIVISEAVGCKKPDPRIFAHALEALAVAAAETWFVGDHPENDVVGARRLGMQAVWLRDARRAWSAGAGEALPAHAVADFGALRALLLTGGA